MEQGLAYQSCVPVLHRQIVGDIPDSEIAHACCQRDIERQEVVRLEVELKGDPDTLSVVPIIT